ncbi:MAG: Trm112 family protein [Fulvivirga sp.]
MQRTLLDKLCCPFDKGDLHIKIFNELEDGEIHEGLLTCPACKRYYPIVYGIAIMTPDEYRQMELEQPLLQKWGVELQIAGDRFRLEENAQQPLKQNT